MTKYYTMLDDDVITNANMLLGLIAEKLAEDSVIDSAEVVTENYYVMIVKPNLFLSAFYKIKGLAFGDEVLPLQFAIMPLRNQPVKSINEVSE